MNKKFTAILNAGKELGYIHRIDSDYSSKAKYAHDCRANGYKVAAILTDEEIDFILNGEYHPENYGMTLAEAFEKSLKYTANVVDFVREVLRDSKTAEPEQAIAETEIAQDTEQAKETPARVTVSSYELEVGKTYILRNPYHHEYEYGEFVYEGTGRNKWGETVYIFGDDSPADTLISEEDIDRGAVCKAPKPEQETAETAQVEEQKQEEVATASIKCGEIEIKPTTPEQAGYIGMIRNIKYATKNNFSVEVADDFSIAVQILQHDLSRPYDMMNVWKQRGYINETHSTHISFDTYFTTTDGREVMQRYNPLLKEKTTLNMDLIRPYTPENLAELLAMAIKAYVDDSDLYIIDVGCDVPYVEDIACKENEQSGIEIGDYKLMRFSEFERLQRQKALSKPIQEISEEEFSAVADDVYTAILHEVVIGNVYEFCLRQMMYGSSHLTKQYAHDRKTGKYYCKVVDVDARNTWIHRLIEKGVV